MLNKLFLLIVTSAYAFILSTRKGSAFTAEHTWLTVVIGVLVVLGFLSREDKDAANKVMQYFVIAGSPMIARSLIRKYVLMND